MISLFRKKPRSYISFLGLLDYQTKTILCVSQNFQLLNHLRDSFLDSEIVDIVAHDYFENFFLKNLINSNEFYMFKWDTTQKKVVKNNLITKALEDKSLLAQAKLKLLKKIFSKIEELRLTAKKDLVYQHIIYMQKEKEATEFKAKNFPDTEIFNYPYILQYADLKNISYRQSAEAILTMAKINSTVFTRSEYLRLYFLDNIKNATNTEELKKVDNEFSNGLA